MGKTTEERLAELEREMAAVKWEQKVTALKMWWQELQTEMVKRQIAKDNQKILAFGFVVEQFGYRTVQFGSVQRAITLASNSYTDILKTQASKKIDLSPLLTFAAFAVLPEYLALAGILKEIAGSRSFRDNTAAAISALKTIGKTIDLVAKTADEVTAQKAEIKEYEAANEIIRTAYDEVLGNQAAAVTVLKQFLEALLDGSVDASDDSPLEMVKGLFAKVGLSIMADQKKDQLIAASDGLAEMLLYDMLHAYTRKYVTLEIAGSEVDEDGNGVLLENVTDNRVEFSGLNDQQRLAVYARFGKTPWKKAMRPPVADWDDLALSWDASIVYRPGKMWIKHSPNSPGQRAARKH